jgi:hypothetical protein
MERTLHVRTSGARDFVVDLTVPLGGLGSDTKSASSTSRRVNTRWVPGVDVWEQVEQFVGHLSLEGVPSFATSTLSSSYALHLRVDDQKMDVPITLSSGIGDFVDAPPNWSPPSEQ